MEGTSTDAIQSLQQQNADLKSRLWEAEDQLDDARRQNDEAVRAAEEEGAQKLATAEDERDDLLQRMRFLERQIGKIR